MEVQRCVWRCLDASPGAESAEYHACVAEQCGEAGPQSTASPVGSGIWNVVADYEGRGQAAWAIDETMGTEIFVVCSPDGRERSIDLLGAEGPDAVLQLNIDGERVFPLMFRNVDGRARAVLEPPFAEIAALQAGNAAALMNADGYAVFSASLRGSSAAIGSACGDVAAVETQANAASDPAASAMEDTAAESVPAEPQTAEVVPTEDSGAWAAEQALARGVNADMTAEMAAEMCVMTCLHVSPGATSPEFQSCSAQYCTEDRLSAILGVGADPPTTTARPGEGPFSPMPWEAADEAGCIAACERVTPGGASTEYQSCMLEYCVPDYPFADYDNSRQVAPEAVAEPIGPPDPGWQLRTSDDGTVRIVEVKDPNSGNAFSVWCPVDGSARSFVMDGPLGPAMLLDLMMGEMNILLKFRPEGSVLRAMLPVGALEIQVLAKAEELAVATTAGGIFMRVRMTGAAEALAEACP